MRRSHRFALCLALTAGAANAADVDAILEAERVFAADVRELGVRDGFLRHLIEESVIYRPLPTAAREWFQAQAPAEFKLAWQPQFAEIAASGDFGYTIGPWTSTPDATEATPSHGYYATVWIKGADDAWHPLADHGIGQVEAAPAVDAITELGGERSGAIHGSYLLNTRYQGLMAVALRLPLAQSAPDSTIDRTWLADDLVVLRAGHPPIRGNEAVRRILLRELGATPPALTVMAESGDLGMSVGGEPRPGQGAYLRLWRHHDTSGWQLAVDVATPVAEPEAEPQPDGSEAPAG